MVNVTILWHTYGSVMVVVMFSAHVSQEIQPTLTSNRNCDVPSPSHCHAEPLALSHPGISQDFRRSGPGKLEVTGRKTRVHWYVERILLSLRNVFIHIYIYILLIYIYIYYIDIYIYILLYFIILYYIILYYIILYYIILYYKYIEYIYK